MSDLVVRDDLTPAVTLFGTDNPAEALGRMTEVSRTLAEVVHKQKLVVRIGQSDHVRVEGWTFLGSLLGVFPIVEWTRAVLVDEQPAGWEARVVARTRAGETVGAAEAECLRSERTWKGRDDYALRSMAQTRAVSKALRLPLGFVMQLAGFDPTPAEEMPVIDAKPRSPAVEEIVAATADLPPVDMTDPSIPFGDSPPEIPKPTAAMLTKLNILVKAELKDVKLDRVYATVGVLRGWSKDETINSTPGARDTEGELHWSPLRDSLSRHEAHELIDRLEKFTTSREPAA